MRSIRGAMKIGTLYLNSVPSLAWFSRSLVLRCRTFFCIPFRQLESDHSQLRVPSPGLTHVGRLREPGVVHGPRGDTSGSYVALSRRASSCSMAALFFAGNPYASSAPTEVRT